MWLEFTFLMGPSAPRWTNATIACLARRGRLLRLAAFAADVVFNLDGFLQAAKGRIFCKTHRLAQTMAHEPRRLVADAEHAMDLIPRNSFLRSRHQEQRRQPFRERDFAFL